MPELKEPTVCEVECKHTDCKHWKTFVGTKCELCEKPVESGQSYFEDIIGKPEHFACVVDKINKEKN